MSLLDRAHLKELSERHGGAFRSASPFPHVVIDDFLPESLARDVASEYALVHDDWKHYVHVNEKKLALTDQAKMPPITQRLFDDLLSDEFVAFMTALTGIEGLVADPSLEGAGMHMIRPGGFLNVHTDFLTHTKQRQWSRQLNILIYLNEGWREEWNGNLELWNEDMSACAHSIAPIFNRCVIFNTLPHSYHGHPRRLSCPPEFARKSLALYYYRDEGVEGQLASTNYRPLPDDSALKRLAIAADRGLLSLYTFVKGRTGLSDSMVSRILKRF